MAPPDETTLGFWTTGLVWLLDCFGAAPKEREAQARLMQQYLGVGVLLLPHGLSGIVHGILVSHGAGLEH